MAKNHGARQQKRLAKQKAKRSENRSLLLRRSSKGPTMRLEGAEKWPIVHALVAAEIWDEGLGSLAIARQQPEGMLVFAIFLVDVYCLGVKNAMWRAGSREEFKALVKGIERTQTLREIAPACFARIVKGAVDYAESFEFHPHPDYRHASMLLEGIDPSACPDQYTFGKDGKPFYVQGPHESLAQARAIVQRIQPLGGHYIVQIPDPGARPITAVGDALDEDDEDDATDELD